MKVATIVSPTAISQTMVDHATMSEACRRPCFLQAATEAGGGERIACRDVGAPSWPADNHGKRLFSRSFSSSRCSDAPHVKILNDKGDHRSGTR